jgi:hypothetical protein
MEVDHLLKNRVACFTGQFIIKYHNTRHHTTGESSITFALGTSDCTISYRNVRCLDKMMVGPSGRTVLTRTSVVDHLLRLWVRIQLRAWMSVCCECCMLSDRGLCDVLTTRPEESYRLWCAVVCDLETSCMRRPWPTGGCRAKRKKNIKWLQHRIPVRAVLVLYRDVNTLRLLLSYLFFLKNFYGCWPLQNN